MSYRSIGPPAFLAGVAAATLDGVFLDMGGMMGWPDGLSMGTWVAIALVAAIGAASLSTRWVGDTPLGPPSILGCSIACAGGGIAVALLPYGWLRLLGGAGFLLMLYLALGLLAGLMDLALRIGKR